MKKRTKQLLAMVLAIALVFGTVPISNAVFAAAGQHECIQHPDVTEWLILDENTTKLEADKYYYLEKDITFTNDLNFNDESGWYYICLNGHNIAFEDGAQLKASDGVSLDIRNCGDAGGKITADLEFSLELYERARALDSSEYEALKSAQFVVYDANRTFSIEASSVDRSDNSLWKVKFDNIPLFNGNYEKNNLELRFKDYKTNEYGQEYLSGTDERQAYIESAFDDENAPIDDPLKKSITTFNPYENVVLSAAILYEEGDIEGNSEFTAHLLRDGEVIRNFTFDANKNANIQFTYLDGYFVVDGDGQLQDTSDTNMEMPVFWDGHQADYSVEVDSDKYSLVLTDIDLIRNTVGSWPSYDYTYIYAIEQGSKVDSVALGVDNPKNGYTLPTSATSSTTGITVEKVEWSQNGNVLESSAKAVAGETYMVTATLKSNSGYYMPYNVSATVNGEEAAYVQKHADGTVTVDYYMTAEDVTEIIYEGFATLTDVDLAFEATEADIQNNLPATVTIQTTEGSKTASVNWTTIPTIDSSDLDGQTITASGTITLPDGVTNPNSVSTDITRKFNVAAAPKVAAPTANVINGSYNVDNDEYTTDITVTLSSEDGATVYYTLDGTVPTVQNGTQYNGPIEIKGTEGSLVEKTLKAIAVKSGKRDSDVATYEYKIDIPNEAPDIIITVKEIPWKNFINNITFGLFFKDTQAVKIEATDEVSDVAKIEYFVSETVYTEEQLKNDSTIVWKTYNSSFSLDPSGKYIVYAKATDTASAANVRYAYSEGFVLYKDSTSTTNSLTYIKTITLTDIVAEIQLNDNTINEVKVGDNVLSSSDYTLSNDGKITFNKIYLENLAKGDYNVTVSVNPADETYVEGGYNDKPFDISFTLKIVDVEENEDGTYTDSEGTTYIPVDNDGDGNPDDFIEVTPNGDGTYEDEDGNQYIPDQDGDGKPEVDSDGDGVFEGSDGDNTYIPDQDGDGKPEVDDDGDGVFDGTDSDNQYIPDQDGDGKPEVDDDGDGVFDGTGSDNTYIPDQDGDGKPEVDDDGDGVFDGTGSDNTYIPDQDGDGKPEVDDDGDGVFDGTGSDNTYIPDQDGDGKPEVDDNGDGVFDGTGSDNTYIPDQDGDGKPEVDDDGDGVFDGTDSDNKYIPDQDGDGKPEVDDDGDGVFDGTGSDNTYIPDQDGDGKPEVDDDGDGVFDGTDSDNKYIPDQDGDGKPEVDDDGDGVFDGTGSDNTYIPDQDGDGKPEVDSDGDGIYEGTADDKTYIPDQDGDGKPEVDSDGDGIYEGTADDNTYIPDQDGDGKPEVDDDDDSVFDGTGSDNTYIPDQDGDGKPEVDDDGDGVFDNAKDLLHYVSDGKGGFVSVTLTYNTSDKTLTWVLGGTKDLVYTVDGPIEKFEGLLLDGVAIDKDNYSYVSGSTVITLDADYLNTLRIDEYTLVAEYADGSGSVTLNVVENSSIAETGDHANIMMWVIICLISIASLVTFIFILKKKESRQ